jgi:hypothetical protein
MMHNSRTEVPATSQGRSEGAHFAGEVLSDFFMAAIIVSNLNDTAAG